MKIKESFDTLEPRDKIMKDIVDNPFATPALDAANENIKEELDNLIASIKSKREVVKNLQNKVRKEALITTVNLNDDSKLPGRNIYFNTSGPKSTLNLLKPQGIISKSDYIALSLDKTTIKGIDPPLSLKQTTMGFETGLYYLGQYRAITGNAPLITLPLRPAGVTGPPLFNQAKIAANNIFTNTTPNANRQFRYGLTNSFMGSNISKLPTKIVDFNLTYIDHLPDFLMSANFISIGYNGYIYVGIEVAEVPLGNSSSFLDVLINNHFGPGSNTPMTSDTMCSADFGSNVPTREGGGADYPGHVKACPKEFPICKNYIPNVHYGLCQTLGTSEGKTGFFEGSQFYGNQKKNITGEVLQFQEQLAEGLSGFYDEQAVIAADIYKNPFLYVEDINASNVWKNIANIEKEEGKVVDTVQSELVYLGILTGFQENPIGPLTNGKVSSVFANGGLKSSKYLGCYKDNPSRVLPTYGGVDSVKGCIEKGNEKGFNLIGVQDGGPGGVGRQNFTDGQCFFSNESLNSLPKCGENSKGLCKADEKDCGGDPAIGGPWRNAIYQNNNSPVVLGCHFYIVPFGKTDPAGTIKYVYREKGETKSIIIWKPSMPYDQSILLPYTPENTGDKNTGRDGITNLTNSGPGVQKGETLDFIWGLNKGSRRYLYSEDYYFRLDLNTKLNKGDDLNKVFMNISTSFTKMKTSPSKYQSLFDYNTTGLKCIVNTDIVGFSKGNIGSQDKRISAVLDFLNRMGNPFPDFTNTIGDFNLLYTIDPIDNELLGRLGFIEFTDIKNNANTPYKVKLYPENMTHHTGKGPAKFVETPGSLDPEFLPKGSFNPSFESVQQSIKFLQDIGTKQDCAKACYNNLEECQAYDFTDDNKCYTFLNKEDKTKDLLTAQQGLLSHNKTSDKVYNLRIPNIANADTCPNPIKDPIVTATIPSALENPKFSRVKSGKFITNTYFTVDETNDIGLCNVGKIINNDEQSLKQAEDDLLQLINKFDSLVSSLAKKEKEIYKSLIEKQEDVENTYDTLERIHTELKTQNKEIPETLKASVDDSVFNLMNSNYNFILWTILAIGIIIAAIHFGRNLKKK